MSHDTEQAQILSQETERVHDPLISKPNKWTKLDKVVLVICCFIDFGDGIETYLPGKALVAPKWHCLVAL